MGNCVRGHRNTKTLHTPHDSSVQTEDHHATSLPIPELQATHPNVTCTEDFGDTHTGTELPHVVVNTHLDSGVGVRCGNTIPCSTSLPPCEHIEVVTTLSPTMARLLTATLAVAIISLPCKRYRLMFRSNQHCLTLEMNLFVINVQGFVLAMISTIKTAPL